MPFDKRSPERRQSARAVAVTKRPQQLHDLVLGSVCEARRRRVRSTKPKEGRLDDICPRTV